MSYLTPSKIPIGYTVSRRKAEAGYRKQDLPTLGRLPTDKPNWLAIASLAIKYVGRDPSVTIVSEGLGRQNWHGRIVILVNEHTVSAGEMVSAFVQENSLARIVGTETAGRLIPGSGFKVGSGYMVIMPKAAYLTWQGQKFEGRGILPDIVVPWSPEAYSTGNDNQLEAALDVVRAMWTLLVIVSSQLLVCFSTTRYMMRPLRSRVAAKSTQSCDSVSPQLPPRSRPWISSREEGYLSESPVAFTLS
jgi:hypothetical protein